MEDDSSDYQSAQGSPEKTLAIGGTCLEFEFPIRKELLCDEPSNKNYFYVTDKVDFSKFDDGRIKEIMLDLDRQLTGSKSHFSNILQNDSFDVCFNLLSAY